MASGAFSSIGLAALVTAALCGWASAQAGCTATMVNLMPCVGYITSNMSAPPVACCSQLDTLVQTQRDCLCLVLTSGMPFSIPVNQTQALALPGACNIKVEALSQCDATRPGSSPVTPAAASAPGGALSPSATSPSIMPSSPSTLNTPSGGGSKAAPGGASVGSSPGLSAHPLFFCFLVAVSSYAAGAISF